MTAQPGTRVLKADRDAIAAAARCLAEGGLVAFPTETVYGLGADASHGETVARLYAAKGRPAFNPLIAHVADINAARGVGVFTPATEKLAAAFWPGPLTLVLAKQPDCGVADLALAGLDTVAVRVPAHPVAHALLEAFHGPIVAPSANRSGHVSPTSATHVLADLRGRIDLVIDAGSCEVGVESTIVSCTDEPTLLRPGGGGCGGSPGGVGLCAEVIAFPPCAVTKHRSVHALGSATSLEQSQRCHEIDSATDGVSTVIR